MKSFKLIPLNILCAFIILYVSILAWSLITATMQHCDNDFKTFSLSLVDHKHPYKITRYVRVFHAEKVKNATTLQTSPPITSVNMNTPLMNVFLNKLLHLSGNMRIDIAVFVAISLVCAGVSVFQLLSFFSISRFFFLPLLMLLWLSWPALYNLKLGQVGFILLPFLVFAFRLQNKKADTALAIFLALLASLKLFFIIFGLFFVVKKEWRRVAIFVFSFFVFFFCPIFYFHWQDFHDFFSIAATRQLFLDRSTMPMNGSILGVVLNVANRLHLLPTQNQITLSASILCGYAAIRWLVYDYVTLRYLPEFVDALRLSFIMLLALLCSPLGWIYYFLFLLVPLATILKISQRYVLSKWIYVFLVDGLLLLYFPFSGKETGVLGFLVSFSVFMSLLCWLFALIIAARAVKCNRRVLEARKQPIWIVGIFSFSVLLNMTLLAFNYGMPYFLSPDKSDYVKSSAPVLWLPIIPITVISNTSNTTPFFPKCGDE